MMSVMKIYENHLVAQKNYTVYTNHMQAAILAITTLGSAAGKP